MTAPGAATELLDWSGGVPERAPDYVAATDAGASYILDRIRSGLTLKPVHAAVEDLLDRAELVMGTAHWGSGIEVGAGAGWAAAALSKRPGVDRIYVLEPSREFVEQVMPVMFEHAGARSDKLVRVIGGFESIELPDESLDFVLGVAALHHADDLAATARELNRVLRPGGFVVAIDRCRPDGTSDEELERLLDMPLAPDIVERYGFAAGRTVRRRDVGEHEHRLSEWKVRFADAGFEVFPFSGVDFSGRRVYHLLGRAWRVFLGRYGERLLRARRFEILAGQIPFELRWLMGDRGQPQSNLFLVCRKVRPAPG